MKYTDIRGKLERIIPAEKDEKGKRTGASLEILVGKEKVCCAFDYNVPTEYIGLEVWYRQWKSGWFSKKIRQELAVYTGKGMKVTALEYPKKEDKKYTGKVSYAD
ncbi:MAG: hypothetical protein AABY26_02850 [Nanoarchaeota archaeon]